MPHRRATPRFAHRRWSASACILVGIFSFDTSAALVHAVAERTRGTTYYVRTDGGTAVQCTGLANAAYPGSGSHRACAWSGPMVALPPPPIYGQLGVPLIHGGDTLIIGAGSYMVGYGAPGAGSCNTGVAYACTMAPLPSGPSPSQPTKILGNSYDSGCHKAPELWGTQRVYTVLGLSGSSNIEVGCLEITDHSACIENHCQIAGSCHGEIDRCRRDTYPFGTWAENGLVASDSHAVYLHDLDIHGLANDGVRAGRLTDWTVDRVKIIGNGFAGWDGDISNGDKSVDTSNHGTIRFHHGEIGYNGCGERYPGGQIYGCWGQEEGGYGDGLGTGRTGGNWVFEDMYVHHNTQDGLDLLYADGTGSITMNRVRAEGNAGNQLKVAGNAVIANTTVTGDCAYFSTPQHVGAGDMQASDACRASGDAIAAALSDGHTTEIRDSTLTGQGGCLVTGSGGGPDAVLKLTDNTLTGQPRWDDKARLTCGYFLYESKAKIVANGNRLLNVKDTSGLHAACGDGAEHPSEDKACRALDRIYKALRGVGAGEHDKQK
jgi:hypothetical protein